MRLALAIGASRRAVPGPACLWFFVPTVGDAAALLVRSSNGQAVPWGAVSTLPFKALWSFDSAPFPGSLVPLALCFDTAMPVACILPLPTTALSEYVAVDGSGQIYRSSHINDGSRRSDYRIDL